MKIRFKLFGEFRELVEEDEVMVDVPLGSRLREAFSAMIKRHPKLDGRVLDEEGSLHACALAFLNGRDTRALEQSNPPLDEADTVVLTSFVGGG